MMPKKGKDKEVLGIIDENTKNKDSYISYAAKMYSPQRNLFKTVEVLIDNIAKIWSIYEG